MTEQIPKLKRFILFGGSAYYPIGGFQDYLGSFDTVEEAKAFADRPETLGSSYSNYDWAHIFDTQENIICESKKSFSVNIADIEWDGPDTIWTLE